MGNTPNMQSQNPIQPQGFGIGMQMDNKPFEDALKFASENEIIRTMYEKQLGDPLKVVQGLLGRK